MRKRLDDRPASFGLWRSAAQLPDRQPFRSSLDHDLNHVRLKAHLDPYRFRGTVGTTPKEPGKLDRK